MIQFFWDSFVMTPVSNSIFLKQSCSFLIPLILGWRTDSFIVSIDDLNESREKSVTYGIPNRNKVELQN
jgi:hypothetical protein